MGYFEEEDRPIIFLLNTINILQFQCNLSHLKRKDRRSSVLPEGEDGAPRRGYGPAAPDEPEPLDPEVPAAAPGTAAAALVAAAAAALDDAAP